MVHTLRMMVQPPCPGDRYSPEKLLKKASPRACIYPPLRSHHSLKVSCSSPLWLHLTSSALSLILSLLSHLQPRHQSAGRLLRIAMAGPLVFTIGGVEEAMQVFGLAAKMTADALAAKAAAEAAAAAAAAMHMVAVVTAAERIGWAIGIVGLVGGVIGVTEWATHSDPPSGGKQHPRRRGCQWFPLVGVQHCRCQANHLEQFSQVATPRPDVFERHSKRGACTLGRFGCGR